MTDSTAVAPRASLLRNGPAGAEPHSSLGTRRAYLAIVLLLAATVVWGFWPSYFAPLLKGGVSRPWIIHVHAVVFIGWIVLLIIQALLVSVGRIRDHRRLGRVGMVYGTAVFGVGLIVSLAAPVLHVRAHQMPVERASLVVMYNRFPCWPRWRSIWRSSGGCIGSRG
jgi:hypothetical protein